MDLAVTGRLFPVHTVPSTDFEAALQPHFRVSFVLRPAAYPFLRRPLHAVIIFDCSST